MKTLLFRKADGSYLVVPNGRPQPRELWGGLPGTARSGTWLRLCFQLRSVDAGTRLRAKIWPVGKPEPTAWYFDYLDDGSSLGEAPHVSGRVGLGTRRSNLRVAPGQRYDNLEIRSLP